MRNRSVGDKRKISPLILLLIFTPVIILAVFFIAKQILESVWDGSGRFTIIVNSEPLILLSLEPRTQKSIIYSIPANTMLNVPSGFEEYRASSVYPLGQLDNKKNGGRLLAKSIENTFGIAVERYISGGSTPLYFSNYKKEDFIKLKKNYLSITSLPKSIIRLLMLKTGHDSDITLLELYHLWNGLRKLRPDQIDYYDIADSSVLVESKLADGTPVRRVDDFILDTLIGNKFEDQSIRLENVTLSVINATEKDKLASQLGRIIRYLGGNVLVKSTSTEALPISCEIHMSDKRFSKSIITAWLMRKYNCLLKYDNIDNPSEQTDIRVILGTEFLK